MKQLVRTSAVVVTLLTGLSACSDDADRSAATSPSAEPTPTSATTEPTDIVGQWVGTWRSNDNQGDAVLTLTHDRPLTGSIDIVDICAADWDEVRRADDVIRVKATVTSGNCIDNQWDVVIDDARLTTTDPQNPTNSVTLTRE
ncbi:hypothetical protein [Aeromicrobium sp. CTD01-1L150]|uniref:hypothetical protein n=1 Tax=Aeromicrobium sp. CTD01-1L150 TaxID=3341830 RepID=UPI0035BF05A6